MQSDHRPNRSKRLLNTQSGFTLIEMLVVLVIIGLLAGLVGPRMFGKVDESKVKAAKAQIKMIRGSLETLRLDTGRFPSAEDGLDILFHRPVDEKMSKYWKGPYLDEEVPLDPWNNDYIYQVPGDNGLPFALFSYGADGTEGGSGVNEDIGYLPPQTTEE